MNDYDYLVITTTGVRRGKFPTGRLPGMMSKVKINTAEAVSKKVKEKVIDSGWVLEGDIPIFIGEAFLPPLKLKSPFSCLGTGGGPLAAVWAANKEAISAVIKDHLPEIKKLLGRDKIEIFTYNWTGQQHLGDHKKVPLLL